MLSKTCKYALRAIIFIGKNCTGKKVRVKEITDEIDVPSHFVAKILQNLVKDGLVASTKGPSGGFYIDRKLSDISLYDIIEVVEGKEYFEFCLLKNEPCNCQNEKETHCPLHAKFGPVKQQVVDYYKQTSIQDIISDMESHEQWVKL
ncbi:MAG: RrF2 family transcriptional regulator [Mangrovibacterium sp.]